MARAAAPRVVTARAEPLLRCERLTKRFGTRAVVSDCTLELREGEIVVIIGPSGCGKTTLLRCINHLETPSSGQVFLRGEPIGGRHVGPARRWIPASESELARQRRRIGFVFQRFNLFHHLTALDNVAIGPHRVLGLPRTEARRIAAAQLARVFLGEYTERRPSQLSGGQQQRVAIARSLAMNPELILFDEPTSALDPELVTEVLEAMRELARQRLTMIVVSHELGFARQVADRVVFMDAGTFVEEGPPEQLFTRAAEERTRRFLSHLAR
jgi:polar amino acid transport system ATP-binding protein